MSSRDDLGQRKLSRRRFLESAGALTAAGLVGIGLGSVTGLPLRPVAEDTVRPALQSPAAARTPSPSYRTPPTPWPLPAASNPEPFSIFWMTDTQFLSESNPALFKMQTNWIVDNWKAFNGKIVIHTGDIVEHGPVQSEWDSADSAMSILLKNGIPYTWCAGNHDDSSNGDPSSGWSGSTWTSAFNPSSVKDRVNALGYTKWVSDYHLGMNTAVSFSANNLNFLVVNIEWNAQPDVLKWVGGLLDDPAYANHRVIVAPHAYIDAFGSLNDPKWGSEIGAFLKGLTPMLDSHSSRVFLTLNGHFATECGYNTPAPINGRNQLMFDRQDCMDRPNDPTGRGVDNVESEPTVSDGEKVGASTVMVLTLDTVNNRLTARSYDVYTGKWRDNTYDQYAITLFSIPPVMMR